MTRFDPFEQVPQRATCALCDRRHDCAVQLALRDLADEGQPPEFCSHFTSADLENEAASLDAARKSHDAAQSELRDLYDTAASPEAVASAEQAVDAARDRHHQKRAALAPRSLPEPF